MTTELRHSTKEAFHLKTLDRRYHDDDATSYGIEEDTNHTMTTKANHLNGTGNEIVPAQEHEHGGQSIRGSLEAAVKSTVAVEQRRRSIRSISSSDHVRIIVGTFPADCLPKCPAPSPVWCGCTWLLRSGVGRRWSLLRSYALQLVEHTFFQIFIVILIVLSSLLLVSQPMIK